MSQEIDIQIPIWNITIFAKDSYEIQFLCNISFKSPDYEQPDCQYKVWKKCVCLLLYIAKFLKAMKVLNSSTKMIPHEQVIRFPS